MCTKWDYEPRLLQAMAETKWTAELEVALFHSMHNHKPVGLNKHFHMACVQWRLQRLHSISLTTEQIWKHLSTLYDLKTLDGFEKFPFPNEEREFHLPQSFFTGHDEAESYYRPQHLSTSPSPTPSPLPKSQPKRKRT